MSLYGVRSGRVSGREWDLDGAGFGWEKGRVWGWVWIVIDGADGVG